MPWHLVVIEKFDVTAADEARKILIRDFCKEGGTACGDTAVEVWHRKDTDISHRYYFSPVAVDCAHETLKSFRSTTCTQKPDLTDFTKLRIL